jgi:hypothetical protein
VWDVLNEPFSSLLFQEKFGSDRAGYYQMLADLFKEVKRLAPNPSCSSTTPGRRASLSSAPSSSPSPAS